MITVVFVAAAVAGTFAYGKWRINEAEKCITTGPIIAAVQTNVPQSVKQSFAAEEQILDELLNKTNNAQQRGRNLSSGLRRWCRRYWNRGLLHLLDDSHQYKLFDKAIREQAGQRQLYSGRRLRGQSAN